ncbi:MAG: TetR/AcrR family transcriptional regulator [Cyclobacteriaceae bacterium]|nr:TetR/AcrR family transcriptional regulator [Cyclobacteriaceae bacterium]
MATLYFKLNPHLYLRDPQQTELGQKIINASVKLIDTLGFEQFTFKKLAEEIDSTEASVYRYFENKHRLLLYLVGWYWTWLEYRIDLFTSSLPTPVEKLRACIRVVATEKKFDDTVEFIDEVALHRIVVAELDKTYLTKQVDSDNREGLFGGFKLLCKKIGGWVSEVNPAYPYPQALVSTILLTAKHQVFFSEHLPSLTNLAKTSDRHGELERFLESLLFKSIS